jgi:hypothetical protein
MVGLAAGYLVYQTYDLGCRYRAWRRRGDLGKDVHRWEGEGGNVPEVETVSPPPPAQPRLTPTAQSRSKVT